MGDVSVFLGTGTLGLQPVVGVHEPSERVLLENLTKFCLASIAIFLTVFQQLDISCLRLSRPYHNNRLGICSHDSVEGGSKYD